ncbi:MAG: acyl-CoA dehydrogenase family protein [Pseudoxanthomonas sp.]
MSNGDSHYQPPLDDYRFVIHEWLDAPAAWRAMPAFAQVDADTADMVVEEIGRFCRDVLAPTNANGDLQGCTLEDGKVRTPDGFRDAYAAFVEAGWPALACDADAGGQGLPQLLDGALNEMIVSANHAWAMYPGLTHGAYAALHAHADEHLRSTYLPRIVSGEWLASMCLTEPQAGSDLGLLRTRAEPADDGSYRLSGNKIFISGGEHDLTDNIVHLVLARLPDAPAGTRGLSLFLAPKRIPEGDGFRENAIFCDGIEKKMGIKGSATCAMRFDNAQAWLVGQPNRGLAAMFVMMNSARLHVGLQGLAHAESAYQLALAYARERKQMRAAVRPQGTSEAADPILLHPPIRRTLLDLRSWTEGMRAIGGWAGHLLDVAEHAADADERDAANALNALLTPIIKSFFTERGFQLASDALQVFGGYGYVHDYRIEQVLRDARISMIYEGTNEIQAIDLLQRKLLGDDGTNLRILLAPLRAEAAAGGTYAAQLAGLCDGFEQAVNDIRTQAAQDAEYPLHCAGDSLRLAGYLLLAHAWARSARLSAGRDDAFHLHKLDSAGHFYNTVAVETDACLARIRAARQALAAIE